jgi:hypothetical protein
MTRLPRELAPWAPFLEAFPEEAAGTIWPWLPRLNTLLGPVRVDSERRSGETDGFDGLTRRGIYDRLVTGEWALLELLPEEFIRRAAMNELLFLKPARKAPHEAKRSVMLFDAGPDELGAPRLVHLALLMIMARRARTSRTTFSWGVLQNPPELLEEFSAGELSRLVSARTWDTPAPGHMDRWAETFASLQPEDLWIVGSPGLAQLARLHNASTIIVDEPLEVPATHLTVSVARPGNAPHRKVRLELPRPDAGIRLLRASSYRKIEPRPAEPCASGPIQFSWNGRRLFARGPDGTLVAYHIPNSSREPVGKGRILRPAPGESLLAASLSGRNWSWVTLSEGRLVGYGPETAAAFSRKPGETYLLNRSPVTYVAEAPPDDGCVSQLVPSCAVSDGAMHLAHCAVFTDGRQTLLGIAGNLVVFCRPHVSWSVDNTETHGRSLLMVEHPPEAPRRLVHGVYGVISDHPFDLGGNGTFQIVNSFTRVTDRTFGINDVGLRWRFCRLAGTKAYLRFDLHQMAGSRVVGWIPPEGEYGEKNSGLLCWTEEPGLVMSISEKRDLVLFNAFKPIRSCLFHPMRGLLALTTDSDMVVYSVMEGRELLRIPRGPA